MKKRASKPDVVMRSLREQNSEFLIASSLRLAVPQYIPSLSTQMATAGAAADAAEGGGPTGRVNDPLAYIDVKSVTMIVGLMWA